MADYLRRTKTPDQLDPLLEVEVAPGKRPRTTALLNTPHVQRRASTHQAQVIRPAIQLRASPREPAGKANVSSANQAPPSPSPETTTEQAATSTALSGILGAIEAWAQGSYANGFDGDMTGQANRILDQPSQRGAPPSKGDSARKGDSAPTPSPVEAPKGPVQKKARLDTPAPKMPALPAARPKGAQRTVQPTTDSIHAAAEAGVSGSAAALPHFEKIQKAFGDHDVSSIAAHIGGAARQACDEMGAEAYASGSDVAFKSAPDLHTTAHEVAHVIQQRDGVNLAGGVGEVGDSYERNADAVADAVVAGKSVGGLLGTPSNCHNRTRRKRTQRKKAQRKQKARTQRRSRRIQRKVTPAGPAYPGEPNYGVAVAETQGAGAIQVPEQMGGGAFTEYSTWITTTMPSKLQAVATSRATLDASYTPHKAAVEAALDLDLKQGVSLEKADEALIGNYQNAMASVHAAATKAGTAGALAMNAGRRINAFQLKAIEDKEDAELADAARGVKAGEGLISDLISLADILIKLKAAGPTGKAAAAYSLKVAVTKKINGIAGLLGAKSAAAEIKAKWAPIKQAMVGQGKIATSDAEMMESYRDDIATHHKTISDMKTEMEDGMERAMTALDSLDMGTLDSHALKACDAYVSAVRPLGASHLKLSVAAAESVGINGWSAWSAAALPWLDAQRNHYTDMHVPAQKPGADEFDEQPQDDGYTLMGNEMAAIEAYAAWVPAAANWALQQRGELGKEVDFASGKHLEPVEKALAAVAKLSAKKPAIK